MSAELKTESYETTEPDFSAVLEQAENIISLKGGRFTAIRKHVYQLLLKAPHPLGAAGFNRLKLS